MFDLVADVSNYRSFLPYCVGSRILSHKTLDNDNQELMAELAIRYKLIFETFESRVILNRQEYRVDAKQSRGPFRHLHNIWHFEPKEDGCVIHFSLDFDFRISILGKIVTPLRDRVVLAMIEAFEKRAEILYAGDA